MVDGNPVELPRSVPQDQPEPLLQRIRDDEPEFQRPLRGGRPALGRPERRGHHVVAHGGSDSHLRVLKGPDVGADLSPLPGLVPPPELHHLVLLLIPQNLGQVGDVAPHSGGLPVPGLEPQLRDVRRCVDDLLPVHLGDAHGYGAGLCAVHHLQKGAVRRGRPGGARPVPHQGLFPRLGGDIPQRLRGAVAGVHVVDHRVQALGGLPPVTGDAVGAGVGPGGQAGPAGRRNGGQTAKLPQVLPGRAPADILFYIR